MPALVRFCAWQVLLDRHHPYAEPVRGADFEMILDGIDAGDARAAPVSRSTRVRLRSVLFRMLREAELIGREGRERAGLLGKVVLR